MNTIIFSTGSNLGDRLSHLDYAKDELNRIGTVTKYSNIYESEAWGNKEQQDFLNQVIEVTTEYSPIECLKKIQEIEKERDRKREKHWGPRTLDIDILFYNQEIINTDKLIIPHPYITSRLFVLVPLSDILGQYIHPVKNENINIILSNCKDNTNVVQYKRQKFI